MLLFMDSFDHYATADITEKWTSMNLATINATAGRRGTAGLRFSNAGASTQKGLPASGSTAVVGVAVKFASLGLAVRFVGIYDAAISRDHVYLQVGPDGAISAWRGGSSALPGGSGGAVLLGTSAAGLISAGVSAYVEVRVVIHDTAGAVTVRVNGAEVLALVNVDTANGASTAWTLVWLGEFAASGTTVDYDDLYVLDGTGAAPWNGFLGDCRVDARYPTGAGAATGWTASAGANWAAVDETAPNDDTDYVAAAAAGVTDTYVTQDAPVVGAAIYGVQHVLSAKKTDSGAATIAPVIRHSGVDYVGANLSPGTAYGYLLQIAATNPGTAAAWTEAGFNAAEFGFTRTT